MKKNKEIGRMFFNTLGLISMICGLLYMLFIFLIGLMPKLFPMAILQSGVRNFLICFLHTALAVLGCIYFMSFFNKSKNDAKLISIGVVNVILYILGIVLFWRFYFSYDTEIIIFITTLSGLLMSVFLWILTVVRYSLQDPQYSKEYTLSIVVKILCFVSILLFVGSIFTYYGITKRFVLKLARVTISAKDNDALSLFFFILAYLSNISIFICAYFLEGRRKKLTRRWQ